MPTTLDHPSPPLATPAPADAAREYPPIATERARRAIATIEVRLAAHAADRVRIPVHSPFTNERLGAIPRATESDVDAAVARARAAQPAWAARSARERAAVLLRFHDRILRERETGLDLAQLEAGKARRDAFQEVLDVANVARYYGVRAPALLAPRRRRGAYPLLVRTLELRQPVGVVGVLIPWNYPLNLAITDTLPALAAGNAVVLKPDHQTSFTALWAAELLYESGLPRDLLPVLTGEGPIVGPPLIDRVDFVMYTGSTRTGQRVATQAAARLIDCSLELGGKNPMLVLADADVDTAAAGLVRGAFVGAGQVCVSIERCYVHRSIYAPFVERVLAHTRALRLGASLGWEVEMGTLAGARQLDTVGQHVEDARALGATILAGGRARPDIGPYCYEPTLIEGATPAMRLYADETFGPVVALYAFDAEEEAVAQANATRYGLNASVWSRRLSHAVAVASRIRAGSVNVNDTYASTWGSVDAPIGGRGMSGLGGRRHGREGLLKYTELQTIAVQRTQMAEGAGEGGRAEMMRWLRRIPGLR